MNRQMKLQIAEKNSLRVQTLRRVPGPAVNTEKAIPLPCRHAHSRLSGNKISCDAAWNVCTAEMLSENSNPDARQDMPQTSDTFISEPNSEKF